jgi:hypothetical protein
MPPETLSILQTYEEADARYNVSVVKLDKAEFLNFLIMKMYGEEE